MSTTTINNFTKVDELVNTIRVLEGKIEILIKQDQYQKSNSDQWFMIINGIIITCMQPLTTLKLNQQIFIVRPFRHSHRMHSQREKSFKPIKLLFYHFKVFKIFYVLSSKQVKIDNFLAFILSYGDLECVDLEYKIRIFLLLLFYNKLHFFSYLNNISK